MSWWIAFLSAAVVAGTPLLFASLGGILCERVGNQNLGIEGMMMMGAVAGFIVAIKTASPLAAMAAAALAGLIGALIYAVLAITLRTNQVVTGLTLTMFGTGLANFLGKPYINLMTPVRVKSFFAAKAIPVLSDIPIIGPIFFKQDLFIYFGYLTVLVLGVYLFKTRPGLNMRAVGQNPAAADAASINVFFVRFGLLIFIARLCAELAGKYYRGLRLDSRRLNHFRDLESVQGRLRLLFVRRLNYFRFPLAGRRHAHQSIFGRYDSLYRHDFGLSSRFPRTQPEKRST